MAARRISSIWRKGFVPGGEEGFACGEAEVSGVHEDVGVACRDEGDLVGTGRGEQGVAGSSGQKQLSQGGVGRLKEVHGEGTAAASGFVDLAHHVVPVVQNAYSGPAAWREARQPAEGVGCAKAARCPREAVTVVIREVDTSYWGTVGTLASDRAHPVKPTMPAG
ncbi:hypothetical protein GCM10010214_59410 [Streptomyces abikoensis]|nr:hypothetical protein GCM10010214_59410 [Streptomyces abikoensis]